MSDIDLHVQGGTRFIDDIPEPEQILFAAVFYSPRAHGKILRLNTETARNGSGVKMILTAADILGENQVGGMLPDEPLLAEETVHFAGQPVAVVVADTEAQALAAREAIKLDLAPLPVLLDPRQAYQQGSLIAPPRTFACGDVDKALSSCAVIVEGRVDSGPQEHVYLETQGALALPGEKGRIKVISATQSPTRVQQIVARVLGLAMHQVEIEVQRLGGAFGGKEDQATPFACMAALAAVKLNRPVKLVLHRQEDMRITGKRHPYSSDYTLGLTAEGRILAYKVTFYQNAGAAADLSTAILERSLFHANGAYYIPNLRATGICGRTNLPPNTAFRGFGGPQAMLVLEAAIERAAVEMGLAPWIIQQQNLLQDGDRFPYGLEAKNCRIRNCWREAEKRYQFQDLVRNVDTFNRTHDMLKKGLYHMPVAFGISFTTTFLNQAGALVHVYTDGSVGVSTGAVEMGQGVNAKISKVVAAVLSVDPSRVRVESTSTVRVANTSPTAASTGADLNGKAAELACRDLLARFKKVVTGYFQKVDTPVVVDEELVEIREETVYIGNRKTTLDWNGLVTAAYLQRVNLSAQAFYATPEIHFDKTTEQGEPFAYHAYGTAVAEVTVDCLRGRYTVDAVRVVHDAGDRVDEQVDLGQIEGGIVQGAGWLTVEELVYDAEGILLTEGLSNYKVPDIYFGPQEIQVHFLEGFDNPLGLLNSKAIGEPPFMYGIGVFQALRAAMRAFRHDLGKVVATPLTPERVLMTLYDGGTI